MDLYLTRQSVINQLVDACIQLGVTNFIIAPGSRSAPLVTALAQRPELNLRIVIDERAAGYVALGMAQQLRRPVGLVCTSGTAALNFAPAVTEAFYQRIPMLVLTADRPPEWIDQQDNQAIHQPRLYEPHVLGSFELPTDVAHADAQWHALRVVSQAIGLAVTPVPGPVHINVPLREPIYPGNQVPQQQSRPKIIQSLPASPRLAPAEWESLRTQWRSAARKLVIAGMHPPDSRVDATLKKLATDPSVAVIADITANLFPDGTAIHHGDMIWGSQDAATLEQLSPDLVVSFGGQVVSKYWKTALRKHPPKALWQLWIGDVAPDPFQALTHTIPMEAADFFDGIAFLVPKSVAKTQAAMNSSYGALWRAMEERAAQKLETFVKGCQFGEFKSVAHVMAALPVDSHLQLGNSMAIRYTNLIGWLPNMGTAHINSNRGTSGIDGTVSTAVGAALTTDKITTLIVGDLAFFYDRNGLWHDNIPANLRIVLLNNHGGGIFDIIEGPNKLDHATQERFFLTPQPLTARRTAEDHGLDYYFADSETSLQSQLSAFFANRQRAAILEIETKMEINTQVFTEFRTLVSKLRLGD